MPRVKRGVTARARHKKVIAQAKGFRGRRNNVFRIAKQAVMNTLLRRPRKPLACAITFLWRARAVTPRLTRGMVALP